MIPTIHRKSAVFKYNIIMVNEKRVYVHRLFSRIKGTGGENYFQAEVGDCSRNEVKHERSSERHEKNGGGYQQANTENAGSRKYA